jgi:hypothetical protein
MSFFSLKKASTSLFILFLCGFPVPDLFASSIIITPDYKVRPAALFLDVNNSQHHLEHPELAEINHHDFLKGDIYAKIVSLGSETYRKPKTDKTVKTVNFRNILNPKMEYGNSGRFFLDQGEYYDSGIEMDNILFKREKKYQVITEETKYMVFIHIATAGIFYLMPESVTKWDKSTMSFSTVTDKWVEDVKSGPVWDKDDWFLNYVGHPYQGAAYYVVARHSGFDWKGAFVYSTILSTFMWEYGFEAFAERPSTQDLIVTPIAGALMGELFLRGEDRIMENGGKVLGSKVLGNISLVFLDPAGSLIRSLKGWIDWPLRIKARTEFFYDPLLMYGNSTPLKQLSDPGSHYGMRLVFTYE